MFGTTEDVLSLLNGVFMALKLISKISSGIRSVKVYCDSDLTEFVVKFYLMGVHRPKADYFCDHKDDALGTAQVMLEHTSNA